MSEARLTMALPKGRMLREVAEMLEHCGVDCSPALADTRKLVFDLGSITLLVVRATDVVTYVEHGAADLGVVGRDTLLESGVEVYEPLDMGLGYCRLVVAKLGDRDDMSPESASHLTVATKYPRLAEAHFRSKGVQAEIIKLYGSIELAPIVGLADRIVDLVSTGETMRQNGLVEEETILESTSRLIVNRASMKTRTAEISGLIRKLKERIGAR